MENKPTLFGDIIRSYREGASKTLKGLADELTQKGHPITLDAISKYERGQRRPGGDFIYYFGKCFHWSDDEVEAAFEALRSDFLDELKEQYYGVQKWQK